MIEYNGTAEEYRYDFLEVRRNAVKLKDVQANIVRKLAAERDWEYREDPFEESEGFRLFSKPYGYKTCACGGEEFKLENNEIVITLLYKPKTPLAGVRYEAVLFHWLANRSYCHVFVCPVYSPPEDSSGHYERSRISWRMRDGSIYCFVHDTYADTADIHDHDHFDVEAGFLYDPAKKELKYYIPE